VIGIGSGLQPCVSVNAHNCSGSGPLPGWTQVTQRESGSCPGVTCCRTRTIVCFQVPGSSGCVGCIGLDAVPAASNNHNCSDSGPAGDAAQANRGESDRVHAASCPEHAQLFELVTLQVRQPCCAWKDPLPPGKECEQLSALNTQQVLGRLDRQRKKN